MTRLTRDAILSTFATYGRPRSQWLVGAEFERHLLRPDGTPLTYGEEGGIRQMIEALGERGWELHFEKENPIAARRSDGAWLTLEPGCQWELSGAPHTTVQAVLEEAAGFNALTTELLAQGPHGGRQVYLGFTPFTGIGDIPWVPKGRYVQMRDFLIKVGDLAHHMMKGTAAVQVSFDFLDEEDCANKMKLSSQLAPLTTALLANSPYADGKPTGYMSWRGHIWTRTDPERTGIPSDRTFSYEAWIDYLLDVPMMFIKSGKNYVSGRDRSFRSWMDTGFDGVFPTWDDWDLHLTQVFPEVRVKKQIEIRGADCAPLPLATAFCALWQGLFYCNATLRDALQLAEDFVEHDTKEQRFEQACRHGLRGEVSGRPTLDWAKDLVALGARALDACAPHDRPLLKPLEDLVADGRSPARVLLDTLGEQPTVEGLLNASAHAD
ncbi:MAG: glutamate--cysteine ligase [Myxococcota bacterium]